MSNYLVTGGAGFIGSHIVERLVSKKEKVTVLDNLSSGKVDNIKPFLNNIEFIEGDIRDESTMMKASKGVDYILHQAAQRSVPRSIDDPMGNHDNNVTGTLSMLIAAWKNNVKRVVIASSSSVYGENDALKQVETLEPNPISPYALSKHMDEEYCQLFSKVYNVSTVCLRYFNVFGPRQDPNSQYSAVIPILATNLMHGEASEIHWHGKQSRDFTYIGNVVSANLRAAEVVGKNIGLGEAYNVGNGENTSINELYDALQEILETSIEPIRLPRRQGDILHTHADINKAKKRLGWQPEVSFIDGLRESVEWYRKNQ